MRRSALSRRKTLNGAGGSILAPARPLRRSMNADAIGPVMARLSAYMSEARNLAPPADVVEKAKHHILDTFAAMISGPNFLQAAPRSSSLGLTAARRSPQSQLPMSFAARSKLRSPMA